MDRITISKLLIVALLFSLISTGNFGITVKADSNEEQITTPYYAPYSPVKNQNKMGSCWMFAAIAAAESNLLKKTKQYETGGLVDGAIDLSEAQAVYTFYNFDKDSNKQKLTYSSNDIRTINGTANMKYLGFKGGALPVDAAMVLCADKGSALESDNPFISRDYPEEYYSLDEEGRNNMATTMIVQDAETMGNIAASQYRLNRFNMKSAEELPNVYNSNYEPNTSVRQLWKDKIEENGAIYAGFYQERTEKQESTKVNLPEDENKDINKSESNQEETAGVPETTTEKETTKKLSIKSGNVNSSNASSETTTEDKRFKYYHAWRDGDKDSDFTEKRYRPNYWYFGTDGGWSSHVIAIVGYDDNYSKYNFAERLVNPDTNETRVYDARIAETKDLKEIVETTEENGETRNIYKPDLQLSKNGYEKDGYSPEYESANANPNQKHFKYIVPKEQGSWIVKNSYGPTRKGLKVFDNGIEHISYSDAGVQSAISLIVDEDLEQILNGEKNYDSTFTHSSIKGEAQTSLDDGTEVAEVYTVDDDVGLEKIGYWTDEENTLTRVRIYKNISQNNAPDSGTLIFDSSNKSSIDKTDNLNFVNPHTNNNDNTDDVNYIKDSFKGYHSIDLKKIERVYKTDNNFSVVITQKVKEGTKYKSAVMMEEGPPYDFNINVGDTFIKDGTSWKDVKVSEPKGSKKGNPLGNSTVKVFGNTFKYDISKFKSTGEYTYPRRTGKVFAGWYEDMEYTTPCKKSKRKGEAYAKFIDANVLRVRAQTNSSYTNIRFVSTIDHLDYKTVGFIIDGMYDNTPITNLTKYTPTVYQSLMESGAPVDISKKFCDTSKYFFTYTIRNMGEGKKSTWNVTPLFKTPDGTLVKGRASNYHLPY